MSTVSRFLGMLLASLLVQPASPNAEVVHVQSRTGEIGHGWLFGSTGSKPGECWIVLPAHVVTKAGAGELTPFFFRDRNGVDGESDTPLPAVKGEAATRAQKEASDLAFARVLSGRKNGACLSRLGVPPFVYSSMISSAPRMAVFNMLNTSFSTFGVELKRGAVDEYGGAVLLFQPLSEKDRKYLQKGISGATIIADRSGSTVPFAMITRVTEAQDTAHALRFDYIKERFGVVEAEDAARQRGERAQTDGIPYRVLGYSAMNLEGGDGPSSLQSKDGCWRAVATGGRSDIELTIEIADAGDFVESLTLQQKDGCMSGPLSYWVDQRVSDGQEWNYIGQCEADPVDPLPCRISLAGPRQLRVRIDARSKVAVHGVILR